MKIRDITESHDMEDSEGYEENPEGASPIDVVWEMPLTYRKKSEVVDAAIRLLTQQWGSYTANQIASEPGFTEELIDAYNYVLKQSRNVTEAAMTPQEQRLRDVIANPYYHAEDEHGTYVRAENKRAIAAAKRMLKAGEVADVVDKSFATGKGTSVGGEAYFDPITKSWGNYRKQSVEPLAHVYIRLK